MDRTLVRKLQERNAQLAKGESVPADFLKSIQTVNFRNFPQQGTINFNSPISAVVGKNGTGKSTVLFLAGCAYAPIPAPGKKTQGKTFNEFVPDTQKDIMPIDSRYGFLYADNTDHRFKWHERKQGDLKRKGSKTWDRRGDRTDRKLKNTIFVGFEKTISNGLLLKDYFSLSNEAFQERLDIIGKENKELIPLKAEVVKIISDVTGKKYTAIQRRTDKFSQLSESCYGYVIDNQYSDIACGSGEIALIRMIDVITSAPRDSLILIDEPENGIHQAAQNKFIEFLINDVLKNGHQAIFTTHSEFFLQNLNADSIILLSASGNTVHPIKANRSVAFKAISERLHPKVLAIVEDDIAKIFLSHILESDPSTREQVKIRAPLADGGWENQIRVEFPKVFAAFKYTQDSLQHLELTPVLVLDGDARSKIDFEGLENEFGSKSKITSYLKKYQQDSLIKKIGRLSGNVGTISFKGIFKHHVPNFEAQQFNELIAEYLQHFQEHTFFLPGNKNPEITLFEWLNTNFKSKSELSKILKSMLPNDKQGRLESFCIEAIPETYSESRDFCKKKIFDLNSFMDGFLNIVISQWVLDEGNKNAVTEVLGKFRELVD